MSATHTIAGAGLVGMLLSAAIGVIVPKPVPLVVHSLTINSDGMVTQDRTINTRADAFFASWSAAVFDVDTGAALEICEGNGAFPYAAGRRSVEMSLERWTGNPKCHYDALPPGRYQLRAVWHWGSSQVSAASSIFVVEDQV